MAVSETLNKLKLRIFNYKRTPPLPKSLLSPVTFTNVVFALRWSSFWRSVPYHFDLAKNILIPTKKSIQELRIMTLIHTIQLMYFGIVLIFLAFERNLVMLIKTRNLFDIAYAFLVSITTTAVFVGVINIGYFKRDEFSYFVNNSTQYCINMRG